MTFNFIKNIHKKVHFIGIGGISMSGLAEILLQNGYNVSGSDIKESELTKKLIKKGAEIYIGQNKNNIKNVDLIVYTAAISPNNPELLYGKQLNIPIMDRAEFIGNIMKEYKYNIAISGTHGKTTTTSMISHIILKAKLDPTILVGGELNIINGNVKVGKSDYFLTEACEYKRSFLKFSPYIGTILNIDADHLDFYKDITDIQNAFISFAKLIPKEGYLIAYAEDEKIEKVIKESRCNIITYGLNKGTFQAKNITYNDKACASFDVFKNNNKLFHIHLKVPGKHNILNSLASISIGLTLNIDILSIVQGLENFKGTHRRFEIKGIKNKITVIDDYAHHPTEIKATLNAIKNYPHKRIFCVFQPHTYSRTLSLFNEFVETFTTCNIDTLILTNIYAAREKNTGKISSSILGDKIREKGILCKNFDTFEDVLSYLNNELKEGDILITMGAGDIWEVGEMFIKSN